MTFINHRSAFLKIFNTTARYHHRHKVFEDFVSCAAIALHNGVAHDAELEKQYLSIIAGYEKEDVTRMAELLGHVVMALDQERCDFLGSVFMELELGDKYRGQFFHAVGRIANDGISAAFRHRCADAGKRLRQQNSAAQSNAQPDHNASSEAFFFAGQYRVCGGYRLPGRAWFMA